MSSVDTKTKASDITPEQHHKNRRRRNLIIAAVLLAWVFGLIAFVMFVQVGGQS